MTDLDLDAIEARRQVACLPYTTEATISAVLTITRIDVPALVALVRAKQSWIDGAKVDLDGYDEARAERDAYLAALGAIASMPSASIAVRDVARHALLNGGNR